MTIWWQEHDEFMREHGPGDDQTLAPHLVRLLDDVEARFVAAGGDAMRWDDPHAVPGEPYERRDTLDEEYGRLAHPGKYAIVEFRMDAWVAALTAPNVDANGAPLGDVTEHDDMAAPGMPTHGNGPDARPPSRVRTLTPRVDAPMMRLAAWTQDPEFLSFEIAVNDPALVALRTPYCGCDACDSGSADLLQEVDQWILSIVDGSFQIVERGHERMERTSFGGGSQWDRDPIYAPDLSVTGRSWWPGRRSRPAPPPE